MRLVGLLIDHWLVAAIIAAILVAVARVGFGRRVRAFWPVVATVFLGGHFLFANVRFGEATRYEMPAWILAGVVGLLLLKTLNLIFTGRWSRHIAWALAAIFVFATGGFLEAVQSSGLTAVRSLRTLEFVQPWWLVLLVVLPVLVRFSYRSLAGLGPIRRWVALGLRCLLVTFLILALAEPRLRRPNENVCVLYVIDRSLSVPQEQNPAASENERDQRWIRLQQFVHTAVQQRGIGHRNDLSGAILFARRPRLVLPPGAVDKLRVRDALAGTMDPNYTDIAASLKLAMASFPEGAGKRVVLISDGNENLGNAEEQANLAKQTGVQIDVIPLAEGYRHENEVLVQGIEAPPQAAKGARLPISVLVRNAHPSRTVFGRLALLQTREGEERSIPMVGKPEEEKSPYRVRLVPGLNPFSFRDKAEAKKVTPEEEQLGLSFSYRAEFFPEGTDDGTGKDAQAGLPGDRIQNNQALAHVIARGSRRVLFIEKEQLQDKSYPHQYLIDRLVAAKFLVLPTTLGKLPQNKDELPVYLSNFDCVVIGDIAADLFTPIQHEAIRSNTHDQGCGLVFVGGPDSYGAGGYQKTPIEAALPVDSEIKAMKAAGRGGLVLIMHASEMADGNKWQKEVAKLAIDRLNAIDMVGVLYYDGSTRWHVKFQQVGDDKNRLKAEIDRMVPGDMMDFDPFLRAACDTLSDPAHALAVKHTIVISDGDPQLNAPGRKALADMKAANITCSSVGVATHSPAEDVKMSEMSDGAAKGGKYYKVTNPNQLPAIYMRESRRVSQSFLYTKEFKPKLSLRTAPADKLDDPLPSLFGFIRTTLKPSALAEMQIEGPRLPDQQFPILATWQYGLGRSAAFTSDAKAVPGPKGSWDRDWAASDIYQKFWESTVGWALRGVETERLVLTTEYREGKVRVVVEARDEANRPITDLKLEGKVSSPGGFREGAVPIDLKFEQRAGGYYEAEFKAEEAGSYIVNARAKQRASAYTGRKQRGLPMTTVEKDGRLELLDGTPVRKDANGKLLYADDGTQVPIEEEKERVVDQRRAGVTVSYSPEFADLEPNSTLLKNLARITGGEVHSEDSMALADLAASRNLYRPAPENVRALLPLWYWLVFLAGVGLLLDVGVRRISLEPGEVKVLAQKVWDRARKVDADASTEDDAFLARLRVKKAVAGENLERERAGRKFDPTGPTTEPPPPGADGAEPTGPPVFTPKPPPKPAPTEAKPEPAEDYFSKLRKAKERAPHDR